MPLKYLLNFLLLVAICINTSCGFLDKKKEIVNSPVDSLTVQKPNIIFILADDLGYGDLSCYGQERFSTPNIDALTAQGMRFTQHYAGSTVCAPSRSALLTGMHTGHTVVRGNKEVYPEGQYPIPDEARLLPEIMKEAGYVTGAFGKWGLGFPGSEGDPLHQGFDTFYGYNCQRFGHHYYPPHLWSDKDSVILEENHGHRKGLYAPEIIHEKTLAFIEEHRNAPFFLYVPSIIPHAELAAPEKELKKYRGRYSPETAYTGVDTGEQYSKGLYGSQKEPRAAYAAMISILDRQVGDIMEKVKRAGIEDRTIIIFTSDNGPHREGGGDPVYFDSNGPLKGFKRDLYEGGIRVPFIVRWPGKIAANSVSDHVSAFWDILPTFSEIAGVDHEVQTDGISFLPTLLGNGEKQEKHEYLYWEFHEKGGRQAVRYGNWKGVKYNVLNQPDAPLELFDLSRDVSEQKNLADQHPGVVKEIERILAGARTSSDIFTFDQNTDQKK